MSDNTKQEIQCFCKWEKDDTDYKGHFKTKYNNEKLIAFMRKCHKCGKYRISLKKDEPLNKEKQFVPAQVVQEQQTF